MPKKKIKHIHRYERAFLGKKGTYKVYRCNLPDCTHYVPEKLAKGKLTLCNRCSKPMIMDARAMRLEKPHCADCIKIRRKNSQADSILEFIEANDMQTQE